MSEPRQDEDEDRNEGKDNDANERDHAWLLARERGEEIGHVPASERAPYEKLGAMLGSGMAPSPGFRRRVLDAIDAEERARRKQQRRWRSAMIGGLAAAAAVAVVWLRRDPAPSHGGAGDEMVAQLGSGERLRVVAKIRHSDRVVRGDSDEATVGDTLEVRAEAAGPAELRVYGGSGGWRLVRCSESEPGDCKIVRQGEVRRFVLEVRLTLLGEVHAVVFVGPNIPTWTGAFDPDLEAAAGAGIEYRVQNPATRVR